MSGTPPAGYRKLPEGTRCRCIRLWQDGVGGFYCCRSSATLAFADSLSQHCPNCEAQAAEIERLGSVIDATAHHWLALQDKHPIQWEGAIDGAMAAACAEIEKLEKAMKVQASAVRTLQANEETEINILRQQKREWHQAVSSLDSEREANAILTAEIERLREALHTPLAFIEALHENDPDDQIADNGMTVLDGLKQQAPSVIKTIRAALGDTK